jgi:hypothetical protein
MFRRILILAVFVALLLTVLPPAQVSYAQDQGICGRLDIGDFGIEGSLLYFQPAGTSDRWVIDLPTNDFASLRALSGNYVRIWNPLIDPYTSDKELYQISDWQQVPNCEPPKPPQVGFSVDRDSIVVGECANLRWDVDNAQAVYLDGQSVSGHESKQVCPTVTTSYNLRAATDGGDINQSVTVNVNQPALTPVPVPVPMPVPPPAPASSGLSVGGMAEVTSGLNMRSAPRTRAGIVLALSAGDTLRIIGGPRAANGYTWWQVQLNGSNVSGWAADLYLVPNPSSPPGNSTCQVQSCTPTTVLWGYQFLGGNTTRFSGCAVYINAQDDDLLGGVQTVSLFQPLENIPYVGAVVGSFDAMTAEGLATEVNKAVNGQERWQDAAWAFFVAGALKQGGDFTNGVLSWWGVRGGIRTFLDHSFFGPILSQMTDYLQNNQNQLQQWANIHTWAYNDTQQCADYDQLTCYSNFQSFLQAYPAAWKFIKPNTVVSCGAGN